MLEFTFFIQNVPTLLFALKISAKLPIFFWPRRALLGHELSLFEPRVAVSGTRYERHV